MNKPSPETAIRKLALGTALIAILGAMSLPNFALPLQKAHAVDFALNETSCENTLGGTWIAVDVTCEISGSAAVVFGDALTISAGSTLHIHVNGILTVGEDGAIANNGTINNEGTINILTFSSFRNHAEGIINNRSTGLISSGDEGFGINNDGIINNDGTIRSSDSGIRNSASGTINNNEEGVLSFSSDSHFLNDGVINNEGGEITLSEADITNNEGGMINNSGAITLPVDSFSRILNGGTINNNAGGIISNGDAMTNSLEGVINNNEGANIDNTGIIVNQGTINDYCGTFTGDWEGISLVNLCSVDPVQMTQELIGDINDADLPKNVRNSLLGPLKQVESKLSDGNAKNDAAACGKLFGFISNLNSKEGSGKLSHDEAAALRSAANEIRLALDCV